MPVVPITKGRQGQPQPSAQPLDPTFAMMAAAQIHSEGRLITKPTPKAPIDAQSIPG